MIRTSYFAAYKTYSRLVNGHVTPFSIARSEPPGWLGEKVHEFVPTKLLLRDYKEGRINQEIYADRYRREVLRYSGDSKRLIEFLNINNALLLCWESPEHFCHRRLVARWIYEKSGIVVREVGFEDWPMPDSPLESPVNVQGSFLGELLNES